MYNKRRAYFDRINFLMSRGALHMKEGDSGEGGGGGGGGGAPTVEELQAKLQEATSAVEKLTGKNSELLTENKTFKDKMKAWDGLDPDNVRNMLDHFDKNEELKLIAEGKHDEVIKKRVEKVEAGYKSKINEKDTSIQDLTGKLTKAETKIRDLLIDSKVVTAFHKEKGLEGATDDVILRAQRAFTIEDGEAVARDEKGDIITGKNGQLTIAEWVAELKTKAGHLFEGSAGAGPEGSGKRGSTSDIDAKMAAASAAGDVAEYRRLKKLKSEGKK